MDWIAEKIFSLLQDILKGDFTNLGQVPALLALIITIGCFLKRKQLERFIRSVVEFFKVKKAESDIKRTERKLRKAAKKFHNKIKELERYKHEFKITKRETLDQIEELQISVGTQRCQVLTKQIHDLDQKYDSSVALIDGLQHLLSAAANISRAEEISMDLDGYTDSLISETNERINSQTRNADEY